MPFVLATRGYLDGKSLVVRGHEADGRAGGHPGADRGARGRDGLGLLGAARVQDRRLARLDDVVPGAPAGWIREDSAGGGRTKKKKEKDSGEHENTNILNN